MTVITTIEDLRQLAKKRVPRMFYDYADSGSWTETTYRANESDFQAIKLRQRVAVNMENRSTAVKMIGIDAKMLAVVAELLLRGPQAPGALKPRVARMGYHAEPDAIEAALRHLAAQHPPLVEQLPLGPRERDRRWLVHVVGV